MDGQRRLSQSLRRVRRRFFLRALAIEPSLRTRALARGAAVLFLGAALLTGTVSGGYLTQPDSPFFDFQSQFANRVGFAADDIRITGLVHHEPQQVLQAIGIKPGGSLIGFDAGQARLKLAGKDWVQTATVQRKFPNQLEIALEEREPFAIWQRGNDYHIIGRDGATMTGIEISRLRNLPLVTGDGANTEADKFIQSLEVAPDLLIRMYAISRVGQRRWNIYLDNGLRILLPEMEVDKALARVTELEARQHILSKGVREIDMRIPDQIIVSIVKPEDQAAVDPNSTSTLTR